MKTLVINGLLMACCAVQGALRWEQKEIKLQVHPSQLSADAHFRFSNEGKEPVTITEIQVTCGCLAPTLARRTYSPGETGELMIRFDLRNRTGPQRKATLISTSDGKQTELITTVDIPSAYTIAPIMMKWLKGNDAPTKTARLTNPNKEPIRLLSAASSNELLPVELKTIREGFEYEVVVSRNPAAANTRAVVRIETEPPPGLTESKTLKFYVYAQ